MICRNAPTCCNFIIMIILCVLVVVFQAKRIAQYTNFPFYERDMDMGEDVNIVVLQEDGYREVEEQYVRRQRRKEWIHW